MPDPEDDHSAIAATLAGDPEAFTPVVVRHHPRLFLALAGLCRSPEEADEIVQEAFVRAYGSLHRYDPGQAFYPWIKTLALNCLRDRLRRQATARDHRAGLARLHEHNLTKTANGHDEEEIQALRACLETLDPAARTLLEARYGGMGAGTAAMTSAVKMRLLRLRQRLRLCIEGRLRPGGTA